MSRRFTSPAGRERRGFSLAEILVAMTVGLVVTTLAFSLVVQIQRGARRVDHRGHVVNDGEAALRRIEGELAFMVPYGFPGCDFSLEVFERDRIRFFSSRDLAHSDNPVDPFRVEGELKLVEISLEQGVEEEGRSGADRLVLATISRSGAEAAEVGLRQVLHAFNPLLSVTLDVAPLGVPAATGRPAALEIGLNIAPLQPSNTPVAPLTRVATTWIESTPREEQP